VITEPIVVHEPSAEWLALLRAETERRGALLVIDEVKAACRIAVGGGTERYGIRPDLVVLGKAIANGFPLAVVGGRREIMAGAARTWISSTLATELVSLAAARATLAVVEREAVPGRLAALGARLLEGFRRLQTRYPHLLTGIGGVPQMCFVQFADEAVSRAVARGAADRGLLFKRSAYNFVSLAHSETLVDRALALLEDAVAAVRP
jgi:glutamate-1-semialdehyde 2,1-aminomutase